MINQNKIELGAEFIFINKDGMKQLATITKIDKRTFTGSFMNSTRFDGVLKIYESHVHFYHSGKKSNRHYNHGDAVEIIGKISL